jgi:hypothetical protein
MGKNRHGGHAQKGRKIDHWFENTANIQTPKKSIPEKGQENTKIEMRSKQWIMI